MSFFSRKHKKTEGHYENKEEWLEEAEGEIAIDAYETKKSFVIVSAIGGISSKNLDISIEDDMLIIKGRRDRPKPKDEDVDYFQKECFWGPFSKKIILPEKIKISQAKATIENGILFLEIPKTSSKTTRKIIVKDK